MFDPVVIDGDKSEKISIARLQRYPESAAWRAREQSILANLGAAITKTIRFYQPEGTSQQKEKNE